MSSTPAIALDIQPPEERSRPYAAFDSEALVQRHVAQAQAPETPCTPTCLRVTITILESIQVLLGITAIGLAISMLTSENDVEENTF